VVQGGEHPVVNAAFGFSQQYQSIISILSPGAHCIVAQVCHTDKKSGEPACVPHPPVCY